MKVGIFFGGQSREREISFAGGRTVYDNLNKAIFEPVPVFIDSLGNFIQLDWEYIYKGTIRDFYPPASFLPATENNFQIYVESLASLDDTELTALIEKVGKRIYPHEFNNLFDFAFLALHGPYGEDGNIQGLLEWYNIPYSGCGILPSAIGINKIIQRDILENAGFNSPKRKIVSRQEWIGYNHSTLLDQLEKEIGFPLVIKAPNQGSSIGVSIIKENDVEKFEQAVNRSLFIKSIDKKYWQGLDDAEKINFIISLIDIREGIGMPVYAGDKKILHPDELIKYLDQASKSGSGAVELTSVNSEESVLFESFIEGKEFSCIVIQQENGEPLALPPTEIVKGKEVFDYRSKYLPGMSRKITPINIPDDQIEAIRKECGRLFKTLHCNVYARIDGFITKDNRIFLNDPNTTSGMLPSSFFFHQAAEIGINPSQFLTYIIRTSLAERVKSGKNNFVLKRQLDELDQQINQLRRTETKKIRVGVVMGGFSSERHISVESGRNIYEKLASSKKYHPVPVFLTGNEQQHELYVLPVNIMLKDNADDIKEKIRSYEQEKHHPLLKKIVAEAGDITAKYVENAILNFKKIDYTELSQYVDAVFIALHGRPGEDGAVQTELEKYHIPYNGSGIESSQLTINKYDTNEELARHGIQVAGHQLVYKEQWESAREKSIAEIESRFSYPFITKPADDGCSSAVKKIKNRNELISFANLMFRQQEELMPHDVQVLNLKAKEEFPIKKHFLVEDLISKGDAQHFLEITGGLLTKKGADGSVIYEVFEPSETLAVGEVLSLEEKFLAGEGQNITPARFSKDAEQNAKISQRVRQVLEKVAKVLNIEGYARIDAFVKIFNKEEVEVYIIEVNSLPGMTPATCIFHQCAINGYKPYNFIDAIINYGIENTKEKLSNTI